VVLVFVNQTITVGNDPPTDTGSSKGAPDKIGGRWLISAFEPRGHGIGVPRIAQPQIVGEVGVELGGGETHLGSGLSGTPSR
jgi:hypothetical protein